jgi:hypothetical protein
MQQAKHTIDILAWELSLTFGLYYKEQGDKKTSILNRLSEKYGKGNWITLQDVLLEKASQGVRIRIMVWRHGFLSYMNRYLYLGEVTIEREVQKLQSKAEKIGIRVKMYHTEVFSSNFINSLIWYPIYLIILKA